MVQGGPFFLLHIPIDVLVIRVVVMGINASQSFVDFFYCTLFLTVCWLQHYKIVSTYRRSKETNSMQDETILGLDLRFRVMTVQCCLNMQLYLLLTTFACFD